MESFLEWLRSNWWWMFIGSVTLIEITPIKFSPIKWLGDRMNANTTKRLEQMEKSIDENEKDRIRYEVLDFANSCRNGRRHTQDEFEHIIVLNDKYEQLLRKTGDTNGVFNAEFDYILEIYRMCQHENDFN